MSRQAGIKEFFPTDKAIYPSSAVEAPSTPGTPSIPPAPPSDPPAPFVSVTPSVADPASTLPEVSESVPSLVPTPTSLKRGAIQHSHPEPISKRTRLSAAITNKTVSTLSPDGVVNPEPDFPNGPLTVWAMTRGDLCDSQHTFKSYQGGAQTKNNVVVSLYVDKYTEPRDFLGRNKLITCA